MGRPNDIELEAASELVLLVTSYQAPSWQDSCVRDKGVDPAHLVFDALQGTIDSCALYNVDSLEENPGCSASDGDLSRGSLEAIQAAPEDGHACGTGIGECEGK